MESNIGVDVSAFKDSIAIVGLPEQENTVFSLDFAGNFYHEISSEWKLVDPLGNVHLVSYQRCLEGPVLFKGFLEIRKFYSLQGVNWCLIMKYKGLSQFDMFIYNEKIEEICYQPTSYQTPAWICYPCFFTCRLSISQAVASQLYLPKHVSDYILHGGVYNWLLRGPPGMQVDCRILGVPHRRYAMFGKGWRAFCSLHELQAGDVLSFFFTGEQFAVIDVIFHPNNY